ncbi:uncharacterized protein LOC135076922 [Ostrinia nubilalis]|uniref:uncharacterized protein LOC135076922 n=1 Tax=Ostrinia nubilalis TaxID=29057 RepID=UPI0030822917
MRRVEEEFQRKRAREKANIRQQLRLVSSGAASMPTTTHHTKTRDEPDGSCRDSPALERPRERRQGHSNASSEISGRSKSTTPIRCVELSEWRTESEARVYRDWGSAHAHPPACARMPMSTHAAYNAHRERARLRADAHVHARRLQRARSEARVYRDWGSAHAHPPACARMPMSTHAAYNAVEVEAFSGSPRSDNYRLEFARGRSPRTPRPPRLLAARSPSTSGSELSLRQPIKISNPPHAHGISRESTKEEPEEPAIVPTLRPSGPARTTVAIR